MAQQRFSDRFETPFHQGPTDDELRAIIYEGDARTLNMVAERMGSELAKSMTASQIRGIFGVVRQIQLNWPADPKLTSQRQQAVRQLVLLKPRMAYQGARHGKGVEDLGKVLARGIDYVGEDRTRFQYFVDFFEAILAYHTAAGGR